MSVSKILAVEKHHEMYVHEWNSVQYVLTNEGQGFCFQPVMLKERPLVLHYIGKITNEWLK